MTEPVAIIEVDNTTVVVGDEVVMTAINSYDVNGETLTFSWILASKPSADAELVDRLTHTTRLTPDVAGEYAVRLRIFNQSGESSIDDVVITALAGGTNTPPIAVAGPHNPSAELNTLYQLDGTGSSDPDGDAITYLWSAYSLPAGSNATLNDPNAAQPTFTPDEYGEYVWKLVVNDGQTDSPPDYVLYTVPAPEPSGQPPLAETTDHIRNAQVGDTVPLDGTASTDQDTPYHDLTFLWTLTERPAGSTAEIASPNSDVATITGDVDGIYRTMLTVTDPEGNSTSANLFVTFRPVNNAPVVTVDPDRVEAVWGERVQILATVTDPDEGDYVSDIAWDQIDNLENPITLYDENGNEGGENELNPILYAPSVNGIWALRVIVRDRENEPSEQPGLFVLEVTQPKTPPTTVVGPNLNRAGGTQARLDATGSYDDDPQSVLTYHWYQVSGTPVELDNSQDPRPRFTVPYLPADEVLEFRCITSDGNASSDGVIQTVTVSAWTGADPTPPVITLNGPAVLYLPLGATYTELGATAWDAWDGAVSVTTSGTVNTGLIGDDEVLYTATDSAGNVAVATRLVKTVAPKVFKHYPVGCYHSGPAIIPEIEPNLDLMHKSFVEGWLVRAEWKHIHTGPGQFDFSKIRQLIDAAAEYGKGINLSIIDSLGSPQWVIDSVGYFDYYFRGTIEAQAGLPWDTAYQYYKREMLNALGAEFDGDSNLRSVYFTYGAMSNGAEFHWRVDETEYTNAGYTYSKLLSGAKRIFDFYVESFPTTCIAIECHPVFEDDGALWLDLYNYAYGMIGTRVCAAAWWAASRIAKNTTGNEGDASAYPAIVYAYNQGSPIICQTIGNFTKRPDRFDLGAGWTTEEAFVNERIYWDGGPLGNAEGLKTSCYEYWTKDLTNEALTPYFVRYINQYYYTMAQVYCVTGQELVQIISEEVLAGVPQKAALVVPGVAPVSIALVEDKSIYLARPWPNVSSLTRAAIIPMGIADNLMTLIDDLNELIPLVDTAKQRTPTVNTSSPGTSITLSLDTHVFYDLTLTESTTAITVTGVVEGAREITLILRQGSGNNAVSWTGVVWPGGTPPSLKTNQGELDAITFLATPTLVVGNAEKL